MAIRMRRGNHTDFDPTKMVLGEVAVVVDGDPNTTSGKGVYVCTSEGQAKQLAFLDEAGGSGVKIGTLTLPTAWSGSGPYTQLVTIQGVTNNSKIDLQPNATVLAQLEKDKVTAMWVQNDNSVVTVYALGAAPTASLTIQYTKTEVITS